MSNIEENLSTIEENLIEFKNDIAQFLKQSSVAGIFLCITAIIAMIVANSTFADAYDAFINLPVIMSAGDFALKKPLLLWVNDGLMAIFFLMVGLELKREFMEGELSDTKKIILPALGALGGIIVPALIFSAMNYNDPVGIQGWAIPAATDIAFALGILALLGKRAPLSLKILLTSIAIFDDIGAIIIIALFYTSKLSLFALGVAAVCCSILFVLNRMNVTAKSLYFLFGIIMWVALLKSGIHATLSGIILAFFIPMKDHLYPNRSPAKMLEHDLHQMVAFFILPVFAFCNAGVNMNGIGPEQIFHDVPIGIALGLFLGKQIGVFSVCWIGIKLRLAQLPGDISWMQLYGLSALCGIGFTMSLFIGGLAYEDSSVNAMFDERIGIIAGSLISGIWGYIVLRYMCGKPQTEDEESNA